MQSSHIDHVGIYLGDGHFVHASSMTGVMVTALDDDYYKERFALAKRLYYE
jgi:lipoprotein Spr